MKKTKLVMLLGVIAGTMTAAQASTVYNYAGNPFTDRSGDLGFLFQQITISLTFDQPLNPSALYTGPSVNGPTLLDWQISDGFTTMTPAIATLTTCMIMTNGTGGIGAWVVAANWNNTLYDESAWGSDQAWVNLAGGDQSGAWNISSPGTWTSPGRTPEPGSFALVASALAAGALLRRRRA